MILCVIGAMFYRSNFFVPYFQQKTQRRAAIFILAFCAHQIFESIT
jgi:hypothetical protein